MAVALDSIGPVASHQYGAHGEYSIVVTPKDWTSSGATVTRDVTLSAPPVNQAPTFEYAQILSQNDFSALVAAGAVDPDGDQLTYTFNWGDGSAPVISTGVIQGHDFPDGVYDAYSVTVTADDGRGGQAVATIIVNFSEPPVNQAPVIQLAQVIEKNGFSVTMAIEASDPNNDDLTYEIDWGWNAGWKAEANRYGVMCIPMDNSINTQPA